MNRPARWLFLFSLGSFVVVVVSGIARRVPGLRSPPYPYAKLLELFHAHFDSLCWLGAAALGATLVWAGHSVKGRERLARALALSYLGGSLLFSLSFVVRIAGHLLGSELVLSRVFLAFIVTGSVGLVVSAALAGWLLWALWRASPPATP